MDSRMYVHPFFMTQLEQVPLLVLYQLVLVNYGAFAAPEDAETFGAAALGLATGRVLPRPVPAGGRIGGERLPG